MSTTYEESPSKTFSSATYESYGMSIALPFHAGGCWWLSAEVPRLLNNCAAIYF